MADNGAVAVAAGTAGVILVWSGIQNRSILTVVSDLIKGSKPAPGPADTAQIAASQAGSVVTNAYAGAVSTAKEAANEALGRLLAAQYGWSTGAEWTSLNAIVMQESGWNNLAQNPTSTAYGIGQFLDTTWATVGGSKTSDAATQISLMLAYIHERYGDPVKAEQFHLANGWY